MLSPKSELYREMAQTTTRIVNQFNQLASLAADPQSMPTVNKGDIYRDIAATLQKIILVLDKLAEAEGAEPIQRATVIKKQKKELKHSGFWTTDQLNLLQELVMKYNDNAKIKAEIKQQHPELASKDIDTKLKVFEKAGRYHPANKRGRVEGHVESDDEDSKRQKTTPKARTSTPKGTGKGTPKAADSDDEA